MSTKMPEIKFRKVFLKMLQNLQESSGARLSFLAKLQVEVCNFIKEEALTQGAFLRILRNF